MKHRCISKTIYVPMDLSRSRRRQVYLSRFHTSLSLTSCADRAKTSNVASPSREQPSKYRWASTRHSRQLDRLKCPAVCIPTYNTLRRSRPKPLMIWSKKNPRAEMQASHSKRNLTRKRSPCRRNRSTLSWRCRCVTHLPSARVRQLNK